MKLSSKGASIAVLSLISGLSFGQTRYVSTTGDDNTNDCTTPGNPCATIHHAITAAIDGDSVLVAPGAYSFTTTLSISTDEIILAAQDQTNKPVITSTTSTLVEIDAEDVSIVGLVFKMGLTPADGLKGIASSTGNFDNITIKNNEFVSTKPFSTGLAFGAYAVQLNSNIGDLMNVLISSNKVYNEVATNDVFGRGFGLGISTLDGPAGIVDNNDITAYYPVQAVRNSGNLNILNNQLKGITMLNYPINNAILKAENNTFDGVNETLAANLYSLVDVRAIETGSVLLSDNTFVNFNTIGLLSMASKNVAVTGNIFTPFTTASNFISIMANTKLMTNGVQGNTFSDEITIQGNTFNAGAADMGTAIVFADHYGVNTPAFATTIVGGNASNQKNVFATTLGNYIALDNQTGASTSYALWAPYPATTMAPFAQDVEAFGVYNNYGFTEFDDVEDKNTDSEDNAALGKVILFADGDNRYVSTTGSDVLNNCTLPGNPCASIAQAISVSIAADSIFVTGGTYPQTSILTVDSDELTIIAQDMTNKPVITTNQSTVFDIDATEVSIKGMKLELGLTATTGKYGITSTTGNYDNVTLTNNEIISTSPVIPYGMVWDAFGIRFDVAGASTVTITDNVIGTATPTGNNIFGRGIKLGSADAAGPGGNVSNNTVKAFYTVQAIQTNSDIAISNNNMNGIAMLNAPTTGTDIVFSGNTIDAVTPMTADSLYTLIEVRSIEVGTLMISGNTLTNYTTNGLMSMASKNVTVANNTFTPAATADKFVSLMANTKLMTNGVQGNTFSDEITIIGNTFNSGAASEGTAILFADHYGVNTPAFASTVVGGTATADKNTFDTDLGKYIQLDSLTGTSTALPLWAAYTATTMRPFVQNVEALVSKNNYGFANLDDIEAKNIDSLDLNILGKVILDYSAGIEESATVIASLYPNPATNVLNIVMNEAGKEATVQIVDVLGNVVYSGSFATQQAVNVSALNSGMYFVKMLADNQSYSTKFIKK